jgi:hypothetical protein
MQEEAARDQKTQQAIQAALVEERSRSKSPMPPVHHAQEAGQRTGAVVGYCAACGVQRLATDRFCSGCGTMHVASHQSNIAAGSPPRYLEEGPMAEDSKELLV